MAPPPFESPHALASTHSPLTSANTRLTEPRETQGHDPSTVNTRNQNTGRRVKERGTSRLDTASRLHTSRHQRPPRPRAPSLRPRSQAITPPAPHPAAPLEPQAQEPQAQAAPLEPQAQPAAMITSTSLPTPSHCAERRRLKSVDGIKGQTRTWDAPRSPMPQRHRNIDRRGRDSAPCPCDPLVDIGRALRRVSLLRRESKVAVTFTAP
jgi:hypothetical protein